MKGLAFIAVTISFLFVLLIVPSKVHAGWVNGYTKSDGTYVNGYWRSDPNGLKYDNYSFDGDWSDAFNDSYYSSDRNYSSDWYTPSWLTQDDYYIGKSFYNNRNTYTNFSYDLYDYDYSYWDDPIYDYTPSYNYGYDYLDYYDTYTSPYSSSLDDYNWNGGYNSYDSYDYSSINSYNSWDTYDYNSYDYNGGNNYYDSYDSCYSYYSC